MLNIAFGQSKYYVDSLSENTKRGLRQKVRRGEYPSIAPIGYINDVRTKSIVVDRKKAKVIKAVFEFYATGNARLEDVSNFLAQRGIMSRGGKRIHKTRATFILSNPFYMGLFRYSKELHEGKHEPIIAKKIFDKVQKVLKQRGRPHHKTKYEPQDFCGLLKCGTCGMSITGEYRIKKQKNGNVHNYIYYHCTKKNKSVKCPEPCIRQEELDKQISSQKQNDWLEPMKEWIKVATTLVKIARDSNLLQKKVAAKEIFGSNLRLASRALRGEPVFPFSAALRAAKSVGKISESLILVGKGGFEPPILAACAPRTHAYSCSATRPLFLSRWDFFSTLHSFVRSDGGLLHFGFRHNRLRKFYLLHFCFFADAAP